MVFFNGFNKRGIPMSQLYRFDYNERIIKDLRTLDSKSYAYPVDITNVIKSEYSVSVPSLGKVLREFIEEIPLLTDTHLGISHDSMNVEFQSTIFTSYFIANVVYPDPITPTTDLYAHLFCYTLDNKTITTSVNLIDYTSS